jgi:excisionase family DNA binding protein
VIANLPSEKRLLISETEAARQLSLSRRTLFDLRRSGELPFVPVGAKILYDPSDLRAWIANKKVAAETAGAAQ